MKYLESLKNGCELVIVVKDPACDSAIFWMSGGTVYTFTRHFGTMKRDDLSEKRLLEHLQMLEAEGSAIFIRGCNQ